MIGFKYPIICVVFVIVSPPQFFFLVDRSEELLFCVELLEKPLPSLDNLIMSLFIKVSSTLVAFYKVVLKSLGPWSWSQ